MKRNFTFFAIVISLLLASTLVLTGCMHSIASDNGETKSYDLDRQNNNSFCLTDGNIIEDTVADLETTPPAQSAMQEKFDVYLHKDGNVVTVFSDEQYSELKEVRKSGKRDPLTYDEILFLINDSISLYFNYDEIRLNNAVVDGVLPTTLGFVASQNGDACMISPYHGDYSEYKSYDPAKQQYERLLQEIYAIIYYRIYMHDAGFARVIHLYTYDPPRELIISEKDYEDYRETDNIGSTVMYQMLAIDGDTAGGLENEEKIVNEYRTRVEWELERATAWYHPDKEIPDINSKILASRVFKSRNYPPLEYKFFIYEPEGGVQTVYPTKELMSMAPQIEGGSIRLTIVETVASGPAFEDDCFYAFDDKKTLYRVMCKDFDGLNEKDTVIVEYINKETLNIPADMTGAHPKYEITATSVRHD